MRWLSVWISDVCSSDLSHTVIDLIDEGFEVFSIDNYANSSPQTLDQIEAVTGVRIKNYEVDLRDKTEIGRASCRERVYSSMVELTLKLLEIIIISRIRN